MRRSRVIKLVSLLLSIMLMFSGCAVRGGGWMNGVEDGKANFGFTVKSTDAFEVKGYFTYHDKGQIKIHGTVTNVASVDFTFDGITYSAYRFSGVYDGDLEFTVIAFGNDVNGKYALDGLSVEADGYFNVGLVRSGNVTYWENEDDD